MQIIDYLINYKYEFTNLGVNEKQQTFLRNCFIKWYINSEKIGFWKLFPSDKLCNSENYNDILFANKNRNMKFEITRIAIESKRMYDKYFELCKDILYIDDNDIQLVNQIRKYSQCSTLDIFMESWSPVLNLLTSVQTNRLKWLYTKYMDNDLKTFSDDYKKLLKLYDLLDMDSTTHLSIPPIIKGVELFGTCVNTYNNEFCSMFEFEKKFGSMGSFWDYNFHRNGVYICNPPFNTHLINKMAIKLIKDLQETEYDVIIIVVLPVWDSDTQQQIGVRDFNLHFDGYDKLIMSEFLKEKKILDKDAYPYINHCKDRFVSSSHTHMIMLSNLPDNKYKKIISIDNLAERWLDFYANN